MFKESLKNNCQYLCSYFEKQLATSTSKINPSIILYGLNSETIYEFAMELARLLNCNENKEPDCQCINCKWINTNTHPAIKTYSNLSNKTKSDESKLTITVAQILQLKEELLVGSDYKRVYIFCAQKEEDNELKCFPLTSKTLPTEASNALLKSIEEPPANTYFIFITKDKNDLLPTIRSRSQLFYVPSFDKPLEDVDGLETLFNNYPFRDYTSAKYFTDKAKQWQQDNKLDMQLCLDYMQQYLSNLLKSNISDTFIANTITSDIIKFENARKQALNSFKDNTIWENITYKIYRN